MVNSVHLVGRLGHDPSMRKTVSGTQVTNFSIATDETRTEDGEKRRTTQWHEVVTFGKLAEICKEYLVKGKLVYVSGRLQTREWETKQGEKRRTTEIIANTMQMLGGRQEEEQEQIYAHPEDTPDTDLDIDSDSIPF